MVGVFEFVIRGLGSSPSQGHCILFLGKVVTSQYPCPLIILSLCGMAKYWVGYR